MKKKNSVKIVFTCFIMVISLFCEPVLAQQSLSLEECRRMALEQNKKIRMANEDANMATFTKKATATKYLPSVSFTGAYMRMNNSMKPLDHDMFLPIVPFNTIDPETGGFNPAALQDPATAMNTLVINPQTGQPVLDASGNPVFKNYAMLPADQMELSMKNIYFARFNVNQPLFTGFKIVEANNIAKHAENIAKENVVLTKAEVLVKTDEAYWRTSSLQEKVKLAKSYESLLDQLVTDLENMYAEGIITRNDLLKAQVSQNEAKLKVIKAENGLALSRMALAQIIGAENEDITLSETVTDNETSDALGLIDSNSSIDNRAEIVMLKEKLSIMESSQNIERSKFMPDILLTGGYGWMNPNPYNGLKKEFGGDWNVGVVVSMPIFTWGERKHNLSSAKLKTQKAQLELEEAREMIDLQIRQNQYKYTEAIRKAEFTQLAKNQAEENMNVAKENLREGMTRLTELLEAQVQWENASSEHIDALIEIKTAKSELDKSTGEIYKYVGDE
ncbi:MAG: TolC family protein [Fermentimonas sp.]|jgi:outer membrane protein